MTFRQWAVEGARASGATEEAIEFAMAGADSFSPEGVPFSDKQIPDEVGIRLKEATRLMLVDGIEEPGLNIINELFDNELI